MSTNPGTTVTAPSACSGTPEGAPEPSAVTTVPVTSSHPGESTPVPVTIRSAVISMTEEPLCWVELGFARFSRRTAGHRPCQDGFAA